MLIHNPNCAMKSGQIQLRKAFLIDQHEPNKNTYERPHSTILSWPLGETSFCTEEYGIEFIVLARNAIFVFVSCSIECIIYYENTINQHAINNHSNYASDSAIPGRCDLPGYTSTP